MLERQAKVLDTGSATQNNMPLKSDYLPAQPVLAWRQVSRAFSLAVLLCAALAVLVPAAQAATYKWIDDKGVVHYSDKMPPEAIKRKFISVRHLSKSWKLSTRQPNSPTRCSWVTVSTTPRL